MTPFPLALMLVFVSSAGLVQAGERVLVPDLHHLRAAGSEREWDDFPLQPEIRTAKASGPSRSGVLWQGEWLLPRFRHDVHLAAIASGPGVRELYWPIPRPYQATSRHTDRRVVGASGAVWIDGDGDGRKTCAREYALRLLKQSPEPTRLIQSLGDYDEAVCIQAVALLRGRGVSLQDKEVRRAARAAGAHVERAFNRYFEAWRSSQIHVGGSELLVPSTPIATEPIPDRLVVLTFDDASKSHFTVARPLLKRRGFGATFFVTEGFDMPTNKRDYMSWEEIAQLHKDGFEIGNHTRDHMGVTDRTVGELAFQVRTLNARCKEHGIPAPVSFAYPGNAITKSALPILKDLGIKFARRGGSPEYPYKEGRGFAYEPGRDHPLLIPSAGDARPAWTLDDFKRAVSQAKRGKVAVLQFHGVPDTAHNWVTTSKPQFETYLQYLADNGFRAIALRDLSRYVSADIVPREPWAVIEERRRQGTVKNGR